MGKKKKGAVCNNPVAMARASGPAPVSGPTIRDYLARDRPSLEEATALIQSAAKRKESGALAAYEEQMNDQYREELRKRRERILGEGESSRGSAKHKKRKKKKTSRSAGRSRSRSRSRSPSPHHHRRKSKKRKGKHRSRHSSDEDSDSESDIDDRERSRKKLGHVEVHRTDTSRSSAHET